MENTNYVTKQTYFSFKAGYYVRVLFIFERENGDKEFGAFACGKVGAGSRFKDEKNFKVALSKSKKKYGQAYIQDTGDARGYYDVAELRSFY